MIQLIMGKIKSKCKINLSRCRRWNQIDAPSVHRICSPEYGSLVAGAQGRVTKSNIQYGVESYFVSFTVLYVSGRPWRGWPELLRSPAYKTTTLRLCTYLRVGCFFLFFCFFGGFFLWNLYQNNKAAITITIFIQSYRASFPNKNVDINIRFTRCAKRA